MSVTRAETANRSLAVLSSLMKHAEDLGLRLEGSNPCRGLRRRKTGFKAYYLTDVEFAALGWALARVEDEYPVGVAVMRFLLYTGARKSECCSACNFDPQYQATSIAYRADRRATHAPDNR